MFPIRLVGVYFNDDLPSPCKHKSAIFDNGSCLEYNTNLPPSCAVYDTVYSPFNMASFPAVSLDITF